jgi:SAM-dependent methyltransferase
LSPSADLPSAPLSDHHGLDRGTPLDRHYIEAFLAERSHLVRGSVLEIESDTYTRRFGGDRVTEHAVVDIDPANEQATFVADLEQAESLPAATYDCIILTQTLHLLREPGQCLRNCRRALRSAGALLVTAPSVSRVSPTYPDADYWRFTPAGMAHLFRRDWRGDFAVEGRGNLRACLGFLMGEVSEEVPDHLLDEHDTRFPLTVAVEARTDSADARRLEGRP